jgi:thioredoxin 1
MASQNEKIKHLQDENFTNEVAKGFTLVDFYADWCGPCRMMTPVIEQFAGEMDGKVNVATLDIDASQKTTQDFGVTSIPTLILFKDGKEVKRIVGVKDLGTLKKLISTAMV